MQIILATTSKYKKKAFGYLGIPFTAEASGVDEKQLQRKSPVKLVTSLARMKAEAVVNRHKGEKIIVI